MRVSQEMKTISLFRDINQTVERMVKNQSQLTSSKRILQPSDDPAGTTRLLNLKSYASRYTRYEENVEDGSHWLINTESALNGIVDTITQIDNILLQANNDTLSEDERKILAGQMEDMLSRLVQYINQKFGDRYLFGGTNNDTEPYTLSNVVEDETFTSVMDAPVLLENAGLTSGSVVVTSDDGLVTYTENTDYTIDYENGTVTVLGTGSMADSTDYLISYETENSLITTLNPEGVDGTIMRKIDEGVTLQINVSATAVFSQAHNLLDVVRQSIAALERNDKQGIGDSRTYIEENLDTVTRVQGEVGSKVTRLDLQKEKLANDQLNLDSLISSIEDADIASLIVQYQEDQIVYEAALRTGASLIQTSLLDFLK